MQGSLVRFENCFLFFIEKPNLLVEAGKNALKTALKRPWEIMKKNWQNL